MPSGCICFYFFSTTTTEPAVRRYALERRVALALEEAGAVEFTGPDGGTVGSRRRKGNGLFVSGLVLLAFGQTTGSSS